VVVVVAAEVLIYDVIGKSTTMCRVCFSVSAEMMQLPSLARVVECTRQLENKTNQSNAYWNNFF